MYPKALVSTHYITAATTKNQARSDFLRILRTRHHLAFINKRSEFRKAGVRRSFSVGGRVAKPSRVKRFIFASSCSLYGLFGRKLPQATKCGLSSPRVTLP